MNLIGYKPAAYSSLFAIQCHHQKSVLRLKKLVAQLKHVLFLFKIDLALKFKVTDKLVCRGLIQLFNILSDSPWCRTFRDATPSSFILVYGKLKLDITKKNANSL